VLKVTEELHSGLYWKKYIYSVTLKQRKLNLLSRGYKIKNVNSAVANHRYWERTGTLSSTDHLTDKDVANLHITAKRLRNINADHRLVFYSGDRCYLYTNSKGLVESLQLTSSIQVTAVKKRSDVLPQDTILLINPTHQFRTYFRSRRFTSENASIRLINWLTTQEQAGEITMSPSLKYWSSRGSLMLGYYSNRTRDYWYVNHNNKSYETMINLVYPGLVRKTASLQRR